MRTSIAILGAGVTGASVAYHLALRGVRDIVLLDRAHEPGGGSTSRATGGFRAQFDCETEIRMSLLSRSKLERFEEETGVDPGYHPHGYLFLARSDDELQALAAAQRLQHACGLHEARMIPAEDAYALNPAIGDASVTGGAFCPTDGFLRPMDILRGYSEAARRLGVRFEYGVEFQECVADGERVSRVRTSGGDVLADTFVNALGAWAGAPVVPMRRCVAATRGTRGLEESMPMTIWAGDWYHLRVRDGRVLLLWPDDPPNPHWLARVKRMTAERVPLLRDIEIDDCWSGLYEMSPDEHALVGISPRFGNLYLATGSSGHGVMHAPAIGQLLAELMLDGRASIDIATLDPSRFPLSVSPR